MNLDSRKSRGLSCILSLLLLAEAALSGSSWRIALWGVAALVWGIRWYRFDRESRVARHAVPNRRRSQAMPWWAWVWAGAVILLTAATASDEWSSGSPIPALLEGATGLWCVIAIRAHFVRSMADRFGRLMLPVSMLAAAWFVSTWVVDLGALPFDPGSSMLVTVALLLLAVTVVTLVMVWPIVLGIRDGLEYWSPARPGTRNL